MRKAITLTVMAALLAASIWGFGSVRQNFFPSSNTPIFFVDLWLPYGTDIATTEKMASDIETSINGQPGVVTTIATVGQGSMRFILTYSGQRQYSNYAQIMVRMDDQRSINALTQHVDSYIARNYPQVNASSKRVMFGPSGDSAIEVRIKGPDPDACACSPARWAIFSPQTRPPTACATTGRTAARLSAHNIPPA